MYSDTCITCEEQGVNTKYFGETSASSFERAGQHLDYARAKSSSSQIYVHVMVAHPELANSRLEDMFRFDVIKTQYSLQQTTE